jgi:hypothetical protein
VKVNKSISGMKFSVNRKQNLFFVAVSVCENFREATSEKLHYVVKWVESFP